MQWNGRFHIPMDCTHGTGNNTTVTELGTKNNKELHRPREDRKPLTILAGYCNACRIECQGKEDVKTHTEVKSQASSIASYCWHCILPMLYHNECNKWWPTKSSSYQNGRRWKLYPDSFLSICSQLCTYAIYVTITEPGCHGVAPSWPKRRDPTYGDLMP